MLILNAYLSFITTFHLYVYYYNINLNISSFVKISPSMHQNIMYFIYVYQ